MSDSWDLGYDGSNYAGNATDDEFLDPRQADDSWDLSKPPDFWDRLGSNFDAVLSNKGKMKSLTDGVAGLGKMMGGGGGEGGGGGGGPQFPPVASGLLNKGAAPQGDLMQQLQQLRLRSQQIASLRGSLNAGQQAPILSSGLLGKG